MKYLILLLMVITLISPLFPVIWEIKQDGTGNFTTIGAGISAAQNGDTLLVYPGIYYENINYQGKNITITSLYDGDQYDESYIENTVIDGNNEGTVVVFNSGETREAVLNGLTVQHGKGEFHYDPNSTWGGGVYIVDSSPVISNCFIRYNKANIGSGVRLYNSGNPLLRGNRISYNHSLSYGAVVASGGPNNLEFCDESLNSIYLNYGGIACDLFFGGYNQSSVVIDTFTVADPDRYFFRVSHNVPSDFNLTVHNGKIEPVAADLFVSPFGDDANSGLTASESLQTIAMAMIKINPDSLSQRTVFVSDGIYSPSLNNQRFPIQLRSYVNIIGTNMEDTILDMEHESMAFFYYTPVVSGNIVGECGNFNVKNFTVINGGNPIYRIREGAIYLYYTTMPITFENIIINNGHTRTSSHIRIFHSSDITLKNIHMHNNIGADAITITGDWGEYLNFYGENIRIRYNEPGPFLPDYTGGYGGGMAIHIPYFEVPFSGTIVNLEITDCLIDNVDPPWQNIPRGMFVTGGITGNLRLINATIGNNSTTTLSGGGVILAGSWDHEIINSIIYGNTPNQLLLRNSYDRTADYSISHSLIQGGQEEIIFYLNPNIDFQWGEGNIDADPLWLGENVSDNEGEYPYMITEFSPARNAGTLNIPNFEFPEFDLAGNPRIYGDYIDMGAYEWNPNVGVENENGLYQVTYPHNYNLYNYPNPVINLRGVGRGKGVGTTISFVMPRAGNALIDIYNIKGQFVKRVIEAYYPAGEYQVLWNGSDEQERIVSTGFYVYRLEIDGTTVATGRCTFIK